MEGLGSRAEHGPRSPGLGQEAREKSLLACLPSGSQSTLTPVREQRKVRLLNCFVLVLQAIGRQCIFVSMEVSDSTSLLWVESCLILVPGFWWLPRTLLWVLDGSGEGEGRWWGGIHGLVPEAKG